MSCAQGLCGLRVLPEAGALDLAALPPPKVEQRIGGGLFYWAVSASAALGATASVPNSAAVDQCHADDWH